MTENTKPFYSSKEIQQLMERGVIISQPEQVCIASDVPLENFEAGCTIHPFSKISGEKTQIKKGAEIGLYGAATLENSWVGENAKVGTLGAVTLKDTVVGTNSILGSGVAEQAVFLGKETMVNDFTTGYGFRVRKGSLYEEDASSAQHTDTKMTVLFPWCTLGSNINFCDVFISGGTAPELGFFSEVGSGTIHFNFSIRGDKATASLFGDVSQGIFLDQNRLFIGGNNSLLGPIQSDFGVMTAAGARVNGKLSAGLNFGHALPKGRVDYDPAVFLGAQGIVKKQLHYIGELTALFHWYQQIRIGCIAQTEDQKHVYRAGLEMVKLNIRERVSQLTRFVEALEGSIEKISNSKPAIQKEISDQQKILELWPKTEKSISNPSAFEIPASDNFFKELSQASQNSNSTYTERIKAITPEMKVIGKQWLASISQRVVDMFEQV